MNSSIGNDTFDINLYRSILAQRDVQDVYKTAEIERKTTILSFEAAAKSLDNASSCDLLKQKLDKYTNTVYKNGNNIYNSLLHEVHPDIANKRQFKVPKNLPKIDLNSYLTNLSCSSDGKKLFCNSSETFGQSAELNQFVDFFVPKVEKLSKTGSGFKEKLSLQERFDNLDKLQKQKQNNLEPVLTNNKLTLAQNSGFDKKELNRNKETSLPSFRTARDEFDIQTNNKFGTTGQQTYSDENINNGSNNKLRTKRSIKNKFVSPLLSRTESSNEIEAKSKSSEQILDPRLKNIEPKMVELIMAEIMDQGAAISWNDIAGLEFAKSAIQEAVIWPMLRPDIFTGLRRPPKGILLFGPPGTGKTLIGKCVAAQSKSTFFCISASSLTSKWIGDGEKMVRALFAVARVHQPSVIFIDEVDSLLSQRSDTEHECSRRMKTEFLVQLDGANTASEERLLVIGATNRPQELDEAARRRFVKRLYIPLPDYKARLDLLEKLISTERHCLSQEDFTIIAKLSNGYSGADIKNLCSEASLGPIRSIDFKNIENIQAADVRPLAMCDFETSLKRVRPSVSPDDLVNYIQWDKTYGSGITM